MTYRGQAYPYKDVETDPLKTESQKLTYKTNLFEVKPRYILGLKVLNFSELPDILS